MTMTLTQCLNNIDRQRLPQRSTQDRLAALSARRANALARRKAGSITFAELVGILQGLKEKEDEIFRDSRGGRNPAA